jgi:hypothetical protein
MFEFSVSKEIIIIIIIIKGGANQEGSGTFISNTSYQGIEN